MCRNEKLMIEIIENRKNSDSKLFRMSALMLAVGVYIGRHINKNKVEALAKDLVISELSKKNDDLKDEIEKIKYER